MAYVGGVHLQEMNLLESEFLNYIDWKLWVEPAEYDFYTQGVQAHFEQVPSPLPQGPQACGKFEGEEQRADAGSLQINE